jgi:hypothetical protein
MACSTFWSFTVLFCSYCCFQFGNKYKFIEYKYDYKKYSKDDIKEAIQTALEFLKDKIKRRGVVEQ